MLENLRKQGKRRRAVGHSSVGQAHHYRFLFLAIWIVLGVGSGIGFMVFAPHFEIQRAGSNEAVLRDGAKTEQRYDDLLQNEMDLSPRQNPTDIRVLSYNIQWGMGTDGVSDLDRIVEQLNRIDPDIAILNEVDVNRRRSGHVDQPRYIQEHAGYPYAYFGNSLTTWQFGNPQLSRYGNLLLSRFPIISVRTVRLPGSIGREPRTAIVALLDVMNEPWLIIGTHLGLNQDERVRQVTEILRVAQQEHVMNHRGTDTSGIVLIMGDFNAGPNGPEIALLTGGRETGDPTMQDARPTLSMNDAHALVGEGNGYSFPFPKPKFRIDYIFVSDTLADDVLQSNALLLPGSDHLPVVTDIDGSARREAF